MTERLNYALLNYKDEIGEYEFVLRFDNFEIAERFGKADTVQEILMNLQSMIGSIVWQMSTGKGKEVDNK